MENNDLAKNHDITEKKNSQTNNLIDMEALIDNLKREDSRTSRILRNLKWVYIGCIFIYTFLSVLNPDPQIMIYQRISGGCFVVSFILLAIILNHFNKNYKQVDYSEPVYVMLSKAANRYKLELKRFLFVLPSLIPIDIGMTLINYHYSPSLMPLEKILYSQMVFISIILIGLTIGIIRWKIRKKPLRDRALSLLKELEA